MIYNNIYIYNYSQKGVGRGQILNSYKHFLQSSKSDTLADNGSSISSLPSQGSNVYEMEEDESLNTNRLWSRLLYFN